MNTPHFYRPDDLVIVADHREEPSGIPKLLGQDQLFDIDIQHLTSGDYLIADLAVERKSEEDFFCSIEDGRLFRQLFEMKRMYRRRLLIVETTKGFQPSPSGKFEGLLTKITAGLQIPILWSRSPIHTATLLRRTALQIYKLTISSPVIRVAQRKEDLEFQLRYILLGFPGIGITRANALLKKFGCLAKIFSAALEELEETPGIGKLHAIRIKALVNSVVR